MKQIVLFVFFAEIVNAQNFVPVWEDTYLPDQEAGCYVSSLDLQNETIFIGRYCGAEDEIVFGDISSEEWTECDIPDSLGEISSGGVVDGVFYVYTESNWILSVDQSCETGIVAKSDGWVKIFSENDTLHVFGSGVYIDDTLSPPFVHSFVPATNTWKSFPSPESESVIGLTIFQNKMFCVGLDDGIQKIFQLDDSVWNVVYVFPEDEHFVSWESAEDRIYVSSTNFAPPFEYGIFSEFKDGDMDSLFSSDGNILAIEATSCFVFVSGNFTSFGNCDAENLAMFDRGSKEIIQTDRGLDNNGYALSANDEFVYVGGAFIYGADIYSPGVISLPSCYEVSVEDITKNEVKIFPNPATDFLSVENGIGKVVRIFSLSEEIYLMANEIDNKKVFDITNLSSGTYYILIGGKVFSFVKL
ncbi:MAG: T9SS type A sorting domain-containing protein [Candidatus Pacebacteria bacterium]|nr:T9SS type A sorting domain-containing protein [Candidatus Paceibacterota bacterium]MBP9770349.1 T9SS type A sorting domain-containing protein [Candidatus Paceibacterota bacterium]